MDNLNDLIPNNIPSSFSDASQFASSNTLVAKIVFLILVIFVFSFFILHVILVNKLYIFTK